MKHLSSSSSQAATANAVPANLKQTKITEDKDLNELQDNVADGLGSLVGKGGAGEGVGEGLSQGL